MRVLSIGSAFILALGLTTFGCAKQGATSNESGAQEATSQETTSNEVASKEAAPKESASVTSAPAASQGSSTNSTSTNYVAVIKTSMGEMVAEFWPDVAPNTVQNFEKLARQGFYDGTCFHRVVKGFMIQGGDPLTKDPSKEEMWGQGGPGYTIKAEFNDRHHDRGVLSMARSNDPDSAGSQFFICDGNPHFLDGKYTAFGKLIKGYDVLDKIANVPVKMVNGENSRPVTRVDVESIRIVPADSVK